MTEKKLYGEERLNRLIDNLPHQMADTIIFNLQRYKSGEITKRKLKKVIKSQLDIHIPGIIAAIDNWKEKNGLK